MLGLLCWSSGRTCARCECACSHLLLPPPPPPALRSNLSYNLIGGTLPSDLPAILPSLEHLGLDHCRVTDQSRDQTLGSWAQAPGNFTRYPSCSASDFIRDGTTYVITGRIPTAWSAWGTTLRTL